MDGIIVKAIAEVFDGTLAGLSSFTGQLKLIDDSFSKVGMGGGVWARRVWEPSVLCVCVERYIQLSVDFSMNIRADSNPTDVYASTCI